MKTLINKTNPRIRISAPEIKVNIDTQTFYIGAEMFDMEDWALVTTGELSIEGLPWPDEEPEMDLEKAAEEYALSLSKSSMGGKEYCKQDFKAGAEWDREQMKFYIKKRMEELWEKLPDADKGTFTNEEVKLLGKYMMLEELDDMLNNGKE